MSPRTHIDPSEEAVRPGPRIDPRRRAGEELPEERTPFFGNPDREASSPSDPGVSREHPDEPHRIPADPRRR
jgi:hypothetical protein